MSHLYRRPKKGGIYWRAYWKAGKLYRESLKTRDRSQAIYLKNKKDRDLLEGKNVAPDQSRDCLGLLEEYQRFNEHRRVKRVNLDTRARIDKFLKWSGISTLNKITERKLQEYLNHRINDDKVGFYEANNTITNLKAWINWAVRMRYIFDNPLRDVKKYKIPVNPKRFLSKEEILKLFTAARDPGIYADGEIILYPAIASGIYTGMRQSEIFSLEWPDVDFSHNLITICSKEGFITKSKKFRTIPLHAALRAILYPIRKAVGRCFDATNSRRVFGRIKREAGLKDIGWHTLRHTFASHLVMRGVDLATVSKLLGHASITTTMIYSHLSKEHIAGAVERLNF
jgi:site-specific recombinase XerD